MSDRPQRLVSVGERAARLILLVLFVLHAPLLVWGLFGLAEQVLDSVPWLPISSDVFPEWMLWAQYSGLIATGLVMVGGLLTRWRWTPMLMIPLYAVLGGLCAIQNFGGMLPRSTHYLEMTFEYVVYAVILLALFRVAEVRLFFRLPVDGDAMPPIPPAR